MDPRQLVNDAVAVTGLLALAWAAARNLDARLLGAALLVASTYRATAPLWHLDHAPGGFQATVQQLVAAAMALAVFRAVRTEAAEPPR